MKIVPSMVAILAIVAIAILAIVGGALAQTTIQQLISTIGTTGTIQIPSGSSNIIYLYHPLSPGASPPPAESYFHQVVDKYFDVAGNEIEVRSATHVVNGDCTSGRRQQDLIAQDNGKGLVQFAQMLMPNEPTQGQKTITAADKVKVLLAANKTVADSTVELASR